MCKVLIDANAHQKTRFKTMCLLAVMLTSGCVGNQSNWQPQAASASSPSHEPTPQSAESNNLVPSIEAAPGNTPNRKAEIYRGKAVTVASSATSRHEAATSSAQSRSQDQDADIILRFSNTPVRDVAQIILGDYLETKYTVAPDVQGQLSLNNQSGVRKQDLLPVLEALLSNIDARLISDSNGYQIVSGAPTNSAPDLSNLQLIPLRYIGANEFVKVLESLPVTAVAIKAGNLVAIGGSDQQIQQAKQLARSFDVNWFSGVSIGLFPVKHTSAETLQSEVLNLIGQEVEQQKASVIRLMAIQRSNTLMVIARQPELIEQVGEWIARLDHAVESGGENFFIYRVQNGRADELAALLRKMFDDTANEAQDDLTTNQNSGTTNFPGSSDKGFRVVADESSNSIIVSGGPEYYHAVRQAMKQLDSTPQQVLVEARIMELTLNDDLQYGLEWFLNGSRASSNTSATLDFGRAGLNAVQPGFSYIIERAGEVRAALNGLADDSRLKVLSSPSLMVLNNRTASILVGDEVPIPTRQVVSTIDPDAPTVNEIEYRNTGILLVVTPRVNSGGMVTMEISQEVSGVVNNTVSEIDAPTIQQRRVNSTVSIRSGQTVVLGGLIREQNSLREAGVPLLKNIPGVGKLFSTTRNAAQRTELVVLITPQVITAGPDSHDITEEYRQKFLGLKPIPLQRM